MNFKEIFDKASNVYKSEFLFALISDDSTLKKKFLDNLKKIKNEKEAEIDLMTFEEFSKNIKSNYEIYKGDMENLNLEDTDWEDYTPRHSGYIPEWAASQHIAEDEADELFEFFEENLVTNLLSNNLEELFIELISFYYAANEAEINDPYENLGDNFFKDKFNDFRKNITEKVSYAVVNDNKIVTVLSLFLKYFESQNKEKHEDIKEFEKLLALLVDKIDNKNRLSPFENITNINPENCSLLSMTIDKKLGNKTSWLQKAKTTLLKDTEIGKKLLEHYLDKDFTEYIKTANKLFKNNPKYWAELLIENIKYEDDANLYKSIHKQICINKHSIENYLKIKDIINESEKENIHQNVGYNLVFRVELYKIEKQYDKIKELVEKNTNSWGFNEIIKPILNIYPKFCFELIYKKTTETIAAERGRSIYQRIASWLSLTKKIKGFEMQTREIINTLYNHKPNLPALKDEFRKAGLI